jgi:DNA or RNA helicases of superfamily II
MKLWKHQEYAVSKYKDREYFGLLFPCGTGKTLTAMRIAEAKDKPVLIIAPNALCQQWQEAIEKDGEAEWETVVCTSRTKNTKTFKKAFDKLCGK